MDFNEYLKNSLEEDNELRREYDALQTEYELIEKLIKARLEANLTQKELAQNSKEFWVSFLQKNTRGYETSRSWCII